jgi:phage regulator Rha-like protein
VWLRFLSAANKKTHRQRCTNSSGGLLQSKVIMNDLSIIGNAVKTMTSREIAELVEKRHDNVKRTVSDLANAGVISYPQIEDGKKAANGVVETVYLLEKRDSFVVVAQLSPEFTARLVDRWQDLEAKAPIELSTMDILKLAMASEQGRLIAIEQRDHAIATKAQIGDKKVATAMATASKFSREATKLRDQLGFNTRHATVIAVEGASGKKFGKQDWRPLKAWCKGNASTSVTVPCARYGKAQAWPAGAWGAVYGVDLAELFGEVAA